MTETSHRQEIRTLEVTEAELAARRAERAERPYDMRRLSYAGTFKNPLKANTIRAIEWATAKVQLLRLIRQFERSGAPFGVPAVPDVRITMRVW